MSPRRGGTGGGVRVSITGTNFLGIVNETQVKIADVPCDVKTISETLIVCVTRNSSKSVMHVDVQVTFNNRGAAVPLNASFSYIDVWSSIYSWGFNPPPGKGKKVDWHLIFSG